MFLFLNFTIEIAQIRDIANIPSVRPSTRRAYSSSSGW